MGSPFFYIMHTGTYGRCYCATVPARTKMIWKKFHFLVDTKTPLCYSIGCIIVHDYALWHYYAQILEIRLQKEQR